MKYGKYTYSYCKTFYPMAHLYIKLLFLNHPSHSQGLAQIDRTTEAGQRSREEQP